MYVQYVRKCTQMSAWVETGQDDHSEGSEGGFRGDQGKGVCGGYHM